MFGASAGYDVFSCTIELANSAEAKMLSNMEFVKGVETMSSKALISHHGVSLVGVSLVGMSSGYASWAT